MDQEDQILDLFRHMAKNIAAQHADEIASITIINGAKPSFDDLMVKLKHLDKALAEQAAKIIESFRSKTNKNTDNLVSECKKVISATIEDFVKTL
jgi:hypothetical protein